MSECLQCWSPVDGAGRPSRIRAPRSFARASWLPNWFSCSSAGCPTVMINQHRSTLKILLCCLHLAPNAKAATRLPSGASLSCLHIQISIVIDQSVNCRTQKWKVIRLFCYHSPITSCSFPLQLHNGTKRSSFLFVYTPVVNTIS